MRNQHTSGPRIHDPRERCYGCFRPKEDCFCGTIPVIDNQTDVLILQHTRERFHAFNTARIVRKALTNSRLLVGHAKALAETKLPLQRRAGLLYPGSGARLISELTPEQCPDQLVILDGTWHHAKTLFRDIPELHALPRYKLAPEEPGRYRIRREPDATSLSTLEATVAAKGLREGAVEAIDVPRNPLDVLARQSVAIVAEGPITIAEIESFLARVDSYASLGRPLLEAVLDMLSGRYPSTDFAELRPRLHWDRGTDVLEARDGAGRIALLSGGTIPDRGQ